MLYIIRHGKTDWNKLKKIQGRSDIPLNEEGRKMAEEAREEGFNDIADLFEMVGGIEKEHEERYRKIAEHLEKGMTFERDGVTIWKCLNCGYIHYGDKAPEVCPVCAHPQAYFEEQSKNY